MSHCIFRELLGFHKRTGKISGVLAKNPDLVVFRINPFWQKYPVLVINKRLISAKVASEPRGGSHY